MKFVGLHAHSLSIGDSIGFPIDHFKFVVENAAEEAGALAITDHGTAIAYGYMLQAYNELKKKGIKFKPIFGSELYIHPNLDTWRQDKELADLAKKTAKKDTSEDTDLVVEIESETKDKTKWYNPVNRRHHMVILAQNKTGLKNLNQIISWSYKTGFYRFPRADFKLFEKYNEGLIMSTACLGGLPAWLIMRDKDKSEEEIFRTLDLELKPLLDIFGHERAYLELQFNKIPEQKMVNDILVKYSHRTGYKLIATADSHYARPEWWKEREIYKILAKQSMGWDVDIKDIPSSIEELKCELYPKNGQQMWDAYKAYHPELDETLVKDALERTYTIAHDMCEMIIPDATFKLPISRKEISPDSRLQNLVEQELSKRQLSKIYSDRAKRELDVICKKGYSNYFLVLKDALDDIQKEYLTGCGRGSGAGSLVCYLLGITKLDPIKHNLLFERFLSENRNEAPDIDNDVEDRDGALQKLKTLFGEDNVVAISNFNSLQLKSLVKDIAKLHQIPYEEVNKVTSVMEFEARQKILDEIGNDQKLYVFDLDGALKHSPTFANFIATYPAVAANIKILFKQLKAIGKHAGGVAIVDNAAENMPLIKIRGELQTPWIEGLTSKQLEQFGIIKYDFLGLATLRTIRNCIERILTSEKIDPTFKNVSLFYEKYLHPDVIEEGEPEVFRKIYHEGKWISIFQFTERKVQDFCQRAKPNSVSDISAITALWRPGPLAGNADVNYIAAIEDPTSIKYEHPVLKEILSPSKGLLIYQEQFMLLAHKLAGFSLTESDELRKLLVKPVQSLGAEMKTKREEAGIKFINGCINNGLSETRANRLWNEEILGFISYGFNKSHSDSYAYISYQCAWLLYHYPQQWIASVLETETQGSSEDKFSIISIVKKFGYDIQFPDINQSKEKWTILDKKVFSAPLNLIKGIGEKPLKLLVEHAPYKTIEDLLFNSKLDYRAVNKRVISALCLCGALSSLQDSRFENDAHFFACVAPEKKAKNAVEFNKLIEASKGQFTAFSKKEIFNNKSELMGFMDIDLLMPAEIRQKLLEKDVKSISHFDIDVDRFCWAYVESSEKKTSKKGNDYVLLKVRGAAFDEHEIYVFNKNGKDIELKSNICAALEISKDIGMGRYAVYDGKVRWIEGE